MIWEGRRSFSLPTFLVRFAVRVGVRVHFVLQQRVEAARGGVVRLVLQDQLAVLQRLGVLVPHDR